MFLGEVFHMSYITFNEVSFTYENSIKPIFENLTFTMPHNRVGIVGNNGCGKSTLLQLISNKLQPSLGVIATQGVIYHVPQIVDTSQSLCKALGLADYENAYRRIQDGGIAEEDFSLMENHWQLFDELKQLLMQMGLPNVDVFGKAIQLSHGQLQMLNLQYAFNQQVDFMLLDEPTNHLDSFHLAQLAELVRNYSGNLIIASHYRSLLQQMDNIVEIENPSKVHLIGGNYDDYIADKQHRIERAKQIYDSVKAEQKKTLSNLQKQHDQQQKRQAKGNNLNKQGNFAQISLDKGKNSAEQFAGKFNKEQKSVKAEMFDKATKAYQNLYEDSAFKLSNIDTQVPENRLIVTTENLVLPFDCGSVEDLRLLGGFRLQIKGQNGSGKSTLIAVLKQVLLPLQGKSKIHVPFTDLTQEVQNQYLDTNLLEIMPSLNTQISQSEMRTHLAQMGLTVDLLGQPISMLSGGEQVKAMLFILLYQEQPPQLLILDEPTNHLDLEGVLALEQFIKNYQGAIIFISHDNDFVNVIEPNLFLNLEDSIWRLN